MRIQHNIMAMNAYRNYNNNTSALSKNLEKLSSGYKIIRAGDDAAGLAISEKMRAQITGLKTATKNVKDGISLVKTGEGAMQEVQDMLNRMVELATQSANGTYDDAVDRNNLQLEVDKLKEEIDRIADSANFNGIKLLDGSLQDGADVAISISGTLGGKAIVQNSDGSYKMTGTAAVGDTVTINGKTYTYKQTTTGSDGKTFKDLATLKKAVEAAEGNGVVTFAGASGATKATKKGKALTLQIGDDSESHNQMKVSVKDLHATALGLDPVSVAKQADAQAAVATIKNAINTVSSVRGELGATQNRLEHTQNNLSVMTENIQDAESTIRDTDVADEMMAYTKNNILVQSAQAMLAQANQVPQGVLQLLQRRPTRCRRAFCSSSSKLFFPVFTVHTKPKPDGGGHFARPRFFEKEPFLCNVKRLPLPGARQSCSKRSKRSGPIPLPCTSWGDAPRRRSWKPPAISFFPRAITAVPITRLFRSTTGGTISPR